MDHIYSFKIASLVKKYGECNCRYFYKGHNIFSVEYEPCNKQAKFWRGCTFWYGKDIPEEDLKNIWEQLIQNTKTKLEDNIEKYKSELQKSINLLSDFNNEFK